MYGIGMDGLVLVEGGWGPTFGTLNGFHKPVRFKTPEEAQKYLNSNMPTLGASVVYIGE